ncbi:hypothetical protein IWW48_000339 [Coemansia sp. RSA 1200]|nr:hypothetical protein IWW48_000339 [Coemansia sp. RSA 1200]
MAMFPPFIYQVAWYHVVKNVSSKSAALYVMPSAIVAGEATENVIGTLLFTRYLGASVGIAIFNTAFQNILTTKLAETVLSHLLYTKYILDAPDNEDVMRLSAVPQTVRDDVAKNNSQALRIAFIANIVYISLAAVLCLPLVLRSLFRKNPVHDDD